MNKQQYWTILAISYARASIMEADAGRRKWLMSRAKRYAKRAESVSSKL